MNSKIQVAIEDLQQAIVTNNNINMEMQTRAHALRTIANQLEFLCIDGIIAVRNTCNDMLDEIIAKNKTDTTILPPAPTTIDVPVTLVELIRNEITKLTHQYSRNERKYACEFCHEMQYHADDKIVHHVTCQGEFIIRSLPTVPA